MSETGRSVPIRARTCRPFVKRNRKFLTDRGKTGDQHSVPSTIEHHRNRERVKDMGEVFTPEQYVQQMLALFDEKLWSDENIIFFEPACGHGNIALAIVERRINALVKKYVQAGIDQPVLHAVATTIHTIWAVDICPLNVHLTRKRIIDMVVRKLQTTDFEIRRLEMNDYIIHVLCTLVWQIHENETLSALSDQGTAQAKASQTKIGDSWIKANSHKPINFDLDWCEFYEQSTARNTVPLLYEKTARFLETSIDSGNRPGFEDFNFARNAVRVLIEPHTRQPIHTEAA